MDNQELLTPNQIIKSKRNSISLCIKNNGEFIVRAPIKCNNDGIFKFISAKQKWIIKKRLEQISNAFLPLTFTNEEKVTLLGRIYTINLVDTNKVKVCDGFIETPYNNSRNKFINFLKAYAKKYISERVELISSLFGFNYSNISITSAKTCWGSCSHNNKLRFTYKLIMCPEDVIDYIVLHELCHTKVKNHSAKFWQLVESCCPNYVIHEKWLKKNRGIVEII